MTIDEALKVRHAHYRIVQVSVHSPNIEKAAWYPNDRALNDWDVSIEHSDGQYGGGVFKGRGATMEAAIDDCVAKFHASIGQRYPEHPTGEQR